MQIKSGEEDTEIDVFDFPEAEPTCIFIDPFACNIDPMSWKELQVALLPSIVCDFSKTPSFPLVVLTGQKGGFKE